MKKEKARKHNFSIENDIWKKFKILCLEQEKTATKVISNFIKKEVEKYEKRKIRQKK